MSGVFATPSCYNDSNKPTNFRDSISKIVKEKIIYGNYNDKVEEQKPQEKNKCLIEKTLNLIGSVFNAVFSESAWEIWRRCLTNREDALSKLTNEWAPLRVILYDKNDLPKEFIDCPIIDDHKLGEVNRQATFNARTTAVFSRLLYIPERFEIYRMSSQGETKKYVFERLSKAPSMADYDEIHRYPIPENYEPSW